jgi:putative transposase
MRTPRDPIYAGHRYPAEIISYGVWLHFRFPLSLRMVEDAGRPRHLGDARDDPANGASNSAGNSPTGFVGERLDVATNGTSMRLSSALLGRSIGSGVRSTGSD